MIYGYLRVSTNRQDLNNQKNAVLKYANGLDLGQVEFVEETISSRKSDRQIYPLIERLKIGDSLIIYELSRLARSMCELGFIRMKIAEKKATLHAISHKLIITPNSSDISTTALVFALEISAQIERQMISERTKNALQAKKAEGMILGRPKGISKLDDHQDEIKKYLAINLNLTAIAKLVGCNRQTLTNWLKLKNI
mgnify:FL=1